MRRVALPLLALLVWTGTARAETVFAGSVADARLALGPSGTPVAAYAANGVLSIATRTVVGAWPSASLTLPSADVELDGLVVDGTGRATVLVRERSGVWLALVSRGMGGSWSRHTILPDTKDGRIGPAGLALDRQGRPVAAYALWLPSRKTFLRLVRGDAKGRFVTSRVTRGGFPATATLPAAAPVVLPSGRIRVVETYLPAAIEWRPIPGDWLGQFLHSTALGVPVGAVAAAVSRSVVFAAWTEAYPTLGPPAVVVASHGTHAKSWLAIEDAVLAGLAVTPRGPELAANRCIPAAAFGVEGNGVCGGLVVDASVDGLVAGFAVGAGGAHDLLLDTGSELDWYRSPGRPSVHVTMRLDAGTLRGRVDGGSGGTVQVYRERPGERSPVATVELAPDGSFAATDPTATPVAAAYRAVYVDPATGIPYAALVPPPS